MDDKRSQKRVFLELFRSGAKSGTLFFFTKNSDTQVMNAPHNLHIMIIPALVRILSRKLKYNWLKMTSHWDGNLLKAVAILLICSV